MAKSRKPSEPNVGAQAPAEAPKLKTFHVAYQVTEIEWYSIEAATADEAEENAFWDGRLISSLDHDTKCVRCREVQS